MRGQDGEYVERGMCWLKGGLIDEVMFSSEVCGKLCKGRWGVGLKEWYYDIDYG